MAHPTVLVSAQVMCLLQSVKCYDLCHGSSTNRYGWMGTRARHRCDLNSTVYTHPSFGCYRGFRYFNAIVFKLRFLWVLLPLGNYYKMNFYTLANSDFSQAPAGCWWRHSVPEGILADITSLEEAGVKGDVLVSHPIFIKTQQICWLRNQGW